MERAVNSQTGEVLFLVNNQWMPPAQVAKNDKGDTAYLVNNRWEIVPGAAAPSGLASLAKPEPILSPEEQMMGAAPAPQEAIPRLPGGQAEMRPYEPSLTDQFMELLPGNKYKAANEYAARQIAKERGVPVGEIYKDIGGARPMFNPEGRAPIRAGVEAAKITAQELPKVPEATLSTFLKAYRAGDIEAPTDAGMVDKAIAAMKPTDAKGKPDPNYESFLGLGESLGFSVATMVTSLTAAAAGEVVAGPVGGVSAGMAASGAMAYRASKDDFLSRVRDKLNGESQKLYGTNISPEDWNKAKKEYNQAAVEYGAWEAIPEAVSNAVFIKAFAAPARAGRGADKIGSFLEKVGSQGVEQATETMTALGQNAAEMKAGLSDEELTIADAFRQQFIQTLLIGGTMAGGMKGKQAAEKFYAEVVEPRVRPGSALAKAIQADIDAVAFNPESTRRAAVEALNPNRAKEQVVAEPGLTSLIQRPQIAMPPPPEEEAPPEEIKAPASSSQDVDAMLREVLGEPDPTIPAGIVKEEALTQEEIDKQEKKAKFLAEMQDLQDDVSDRDDKYFETPPPKVEAPKEPTLKDQYDKAAKLNFIAPDAFRDKRITQEQYDQIKSDYERLKAEYQASIPKATLNPIQQEATDIADKLEELGQTPFVTGMRAAIEKDRVNEQNLEFYRTKLKQEQAKQGTLEEGVERPSEKWDWSNFYRDEPKGLEKLKLFNSKAPPAVKQALQTVTDTLQALTNRLNDEGYTMYGTPSSNMPQDIKNLRSQIQMRSAGGVKLINAFEALNKGFNRSKKTTNKENLDAAIRDIKADAAEAQKVLQRSIPEPEEVVNARAAIAEATKRVESLEYKSGSLWGALMGRLAPEEVREIFGPNPSLGEKKLQVTKKSGKRGTYISEIAADGLLDPFLPPAMRHESSRFDAAESAQYIKDAVANKDYLPHDAKAEIEDIYRAVEPLGDLIDEYLTIEEQNRELQIAFDEQREADQAAEIVEPQDEDRAAKPSEGQEREPLELTAPTEDELTAKQDEIDRLTKENERLAKEAERKAKADEEAKDFVLTGSKRDADVAAARGQKDIFAEEAPKKEPEKEESVAEMKKRLNTLMMQNMKSLDENPALEKEIDELTQKLRDAGKKPKKAKEEPAAEPEVPEGTVATPDGAVLRYPLAVSMVGEGYKVLALDDARTYKDKGGEPHRTFEKGPLRIAMTPQRVLFQNRNAVNVAFGNPDQVTLEAIMVDPGSRNQGLATQAMNDVIAAADQNEITLYLEPVPIVNVKKNDFGLDRDQLVDFYSNFGFEFQEDSNKVMQRKPSAEVAEEVLPAVEEEVAGELGFEPYTIEGDFTEVAEEQQRLMLENQTENLSDAQVSTLEKHYGATIDTDEFFTKLREDVSNFIVKGATAVNGKIRAIIRQLANGVLAVGIAFNPQYMSQPINVFMPIDNVRTEEVLAQVPDAATDKMSEPAKRAFAVIYPALQEQMVAKDKLFIMADKPSGRVFVFNPDGSLLLEKKSLFGLAKGDLYVGDNEKPQNRITPAGLFDLKFVDAAKGAAEKRTAGDYDTGTVLAINDPDGTITIMHSVWLKEKDAAQRAAALRNDSPADSRYSFGCINVDAPTYSFLVNNHAKQMDGAALFIVPEAGVDVMSFITGKGAMSEDLARIKIKPVTKEVRTPQRQATQAEAKTKTPGREQQFFSLEKQTGTQAFKKWFGDSRVVDANGNPLIVYHGTNEDFYAFDPYAEKKTQGGERLRGTNAIFFSSSPELASAYAGVAKSTLTGQSFAYPAESAYGGNVMPVYLSMQNPMIVDAEGQMYTKVEPLIREAKKKGHDGVIFKNVADQPGAAGSLQVTTHDAYVVFKPEQIKSATGNRGTFDESRNINMSVEGKKLPPGRSPELAAAARQVKEGTMTAAEFDKLVNKYRPITPYEKPLKPATTAQMVDALSSDKKDKVNPDIPEGTRVGLRLDIPAFNRKGVYVVTIHEKGNASGPGRAIGYDSVATINNVTFGTGNQRKGLNIATGEAKDALQTMEGEFVKTDPAQAYVDAVMAMDDPEWTQIGVDPARHSYFYDRNTTQPVIAAEQVIQIGNMVLAKNVTYGRKEDFLYNIEDDLVKLINDNTDSIDETEKKRSPSLIRKIKTLTNQRNQGKLTDEEYLDRVNAAIDEDYENDLLTVRKSRVRGADFIREKLLNAKRKGFLSEEAVDLAEWFIGQNPDLVDDLGISIKAKGPSGAGGFYNPLARVITLIKERGSDLTTTHEILHHLERMMPAKIQAAIRKAWLTQLLKANKAATDPAQKLYFMALLDAHIGNNNHTRLEIPEGSEGIYKAIVEQMKFANELAGGRGADPKSSALARELLLYSPTVPSELYEYFDPSEFWAVNGSDIVRARYDAVKGGVLARLKNWLREFAQKVKSLFGMKSDASIIRALDSLAKSDGQYVTNEMLGTGDYQNIKKNAFGGEMPKATWAMKESNNFDDWVQTWQDNYRDLKNVQKIITDKIGKIDDRLNAYRKETLNPGREAEQAQEFLKYEVDPLIKEMRKNNVSNEELATYLHNRYAEERNVIINAKNKSPAVQDQGSGISTENARKYLKALPADRAKVLESLAARIDGIVRGSQDILVESGQETQETISGWRKESPHYVPLRRDESELDFIVQSSSGNLGGYATAGKFGKEALGSTKTVKDILENIMLQRDRAIRRAESIRIGQALYGLAIKYPNPDFYMAINPDAVKDMDALIAEMEEMGLDPELIENILEQPKTGFVKKTTGPEGETVREVKYRVDRAYQNAKNVFPIRINGQNRFVLFNPKSPEAMRLAAELKQLNSEKLGVFFGAASTLSRWFAAVNTQYNPAFGIVNIINDSQGALVNLSTTPLAGQQADVAKSILPALRGIARDIRKERKQTTKSVIKTEYDPDNIKPEDWTSMWRLFRQAGGKTGFRDQMVRQRMDVEWRGFIPHFKFEDENAMTKAMEKIEQGPIKKKVEWFADAFSDFNDTLENTVRLAVFKVAYVDNNLSVEEAAEIAKNITVNFNKRGARTKTVRGLYAFFNASLQGTARYAITLAGQSGPLIIKTGLAMGAVNAMWMFMAGFDDDDPPQFTKNKGFIVPTGSGDYFIWNLPPGLRAIPNTGRLLTEAMLISVGLTKSNRGLGGKITDVGSVLVDAVNPFGGGTFMQTIAPTFLDPAIALAENKDSFGRPIFKEDQSLSPTPGWQRSRDSASAFSKNLAWFLNTVSAGGEEFNKGFISPTGDQLDFLIGQATGGLGRDIKRSVDLAVNKYEGEETPAYRVPLANRFLGETKTEASTAARFYDNVTMLARHENVLNGRIDNKGDVQGYYKENPIAKYAFVANDFENDVSSLNKTISDIRKLPDTKENKDKIKRIKEAKLKTMETLNDLVRKAQ